MLLGRDADVYFTGEMTHVRIIFFFLAGPSGPWCSCSWSQHEVLAAVAAGKYVILCKCIYVIITLWAQFHRFQGGHSNTERGYLPILATKLHHELQSNEFKDQGLGDVEVLVSQKDQHPLVFVWIMKLILPNFKMDKHSERWAWEHVYSSPFVRAVYHSVCRRI